VAGYRLEKLLRTLFELCDPDPRASFKIVGEQIDGAFTFEGTDYLFEGKWQQELVSAADLDILAGKVSRKLDNTLGLFLSVNGFSEDGKWRVENGEWRMENGEWSMENGNSGNSQFSTLNSQLKNIRLPGFHGECEVKRLGDVAEIVMGQSPSSSNYNKQGDGFPLIQGNADVSNRKTIARVFTTQITKKGRIGDILMSVRAPIGEMSRATFDVCLGRGVCAIRFPNDFLYHCLIFLEPTWAKHSKGSTFDSVNSNDVKAVEIRLPADDDEQSAIAAVLSDMDAELAALEARRDKTRALKQAMMQELLTGRVRSVN
jgi:hypothetical protein